MYWPFAQGLEVELCHVACLSTRTSLSLDHVVDSLSEAHI